MNHHARQIINYFVSSENREYLLTELINTTNISPQNQKVRRYLQFTFYDNMKFYVRAMEQELNSSDPMIGTTVDSEVRYFNRQFIKEQIKFLQHYVSESIFPQHYHAGESLRYQEQNNFDHSDDILKKWKDNSARPRAPRDDCDGDERYDDVSINDITAGIAVCDQSTLGTQNHLSQYENTLYKSALNVGPHYLNTPFGVSTPAADARLLSRNTFRKNELGAENAIPRREVRLHSRSIERSNEGFRSGERESILAPSTSALQSLRCRITHRK